MDSYNVIGGWGVEDWITFNKGQSKQFTIQLRGTAIRYRIILPSIALKSGTPPLLH